MQPYATASDPSPLNGNRPTVNVNTSVNNSFFTQYRTQILYGVGLIVFILIITIATRKRSSLYDVGKVEAVKKSKKKSGVCPKGCVPAKKVIKKKDYKKDTSFDPALTDKTTTVKADVVNKI